MRHKIIFLLYLVSTSFNLMSQIKVDLDVSGRNSSEVTESGYSACYPVSTASYTESVHSFKLNTGSLTDDL